MKACQYVNERKPVILREIANEQAARRRFHPKIRPSVVPFTAFHVARGGLSYCQRSPFAASSAVKTARLNYFSACKIRPFARFLVPYYCSLDGWCGVKCWLCNSYACTLLLAIFPHKEFVLPSNAVSERCRKPACHGFSWYCSKVSAARKAFCRTAVGRMLKKHRTPTDFSFFIFHFSFNIVPLQPNSENPMHSTPGAPVIDGLAGGRM